MNKALKHYGVALLAIFIFLILAVSISLVHSFDVFWQLQNGRYMTETMSLIHTDLFTLAADAPRYEHTWLHSLILYGLYKLFGYGSISVLKGVIVSLTACILILAARSRGSSCLAIALVLPVYLFTSSGWLERPQLWTFLGTAFFIWCLEKYLSKPTWRIFWLLPLALFWSNLHAGSILAVALVSAYLVGETGQSIIAKRFSWQKALQLLGLLAGVLLASLVSPYPSRWFNTLLNSFHLGASVSSSGKVTGSATAVYNMDWTPTTFQGEPLFFYFLGFSAFILLLGWRRIRLSDLCLMGGLALMGLKLIRHIPFFYMGMVAILPTYLDQISQSVRQRLPELYRKVAIVIICLMAIGCFWVVWKPLFRVYGMFNAGLRTWHYPIAATEFVSEQKLAGNIYNTYDWGGYMEFKLFPDYLMFWDGRQDSPEMFQLGWNVMAGKPDWEQILDRFSVNTIVTRASTIDTGQKYPLLDRLAESTSWELVFNTESSLVFVRRGSMPDVWLRKYARPKELIDNTVLSEALLMVRVNPSRYMAWWEMAQIYNKRKQYKNALLALDQHIARAPGRNPVAEKLRRQLMSQLKTSNGH